MRIVRITGSVFVKTGAIADAPARHYAFANNMAKYHCPQRPSLRA